MIERPKLPAKPTIFRAFDSSSISIGDDNKVSTYELTPSPIVSVAYTRRNRPPMPGIKRNDPVPQKSSILRQPSGPSPQPYRRAIVNELVDSEDESSRASYLSTNDDEDDDEEKENELNSVNEEEEDDEEDEYESKESEKEKISDSAKETIDSRKFQLEKIPETPLVDKKKNAQQDNNNPMTPPSSVARPIRLFQGFDMSDMKKFLMNPIPKDAGVVQCYIKRNRIGMNKLYPIYSIYLKTGDKFLMSSRKRPNNKTSNYLISMSEYDMNRVGGNYLGKLRSNFVGTEFQMFDDGINPKDADDIVNTSSTTATSAGTTTTTPQFVNKDARQELGVIIYAANVLGSRGPRKMQVALPEVDEYNIRKPTRVSRASAISAATRTATPDNNNNSSRDSTLGRPRTGSLASSLARRFSFSTATTTTSVGKSSGSAHLPTTTTEGSPRVYDDLLGMVKDRCYQDLNYYINKPPRWNEQVYR